MRSASSTVHRRLRRNLSIPPLSKQNRLQRCCVTFKQSREFSFATTFENPAYCAKHAFECVCVRTGQMALIGKTIDGHPADAIMILRRSSPKVCGQQ